MEYLRNRTSAVYKCASTVYKCTTVSPIKTGLCLAVGVLAPLLTYNHYTMEGDITLNWGSDDKLEYHKPKNAWLYKEVKTC